jgi:hypothetical protein
LAELSGDVLFERCVFRDNALVEAETVCEFQGRQISFRDCEIEKGNFAAYWNNGLNEYHYYDTKVVDLGGNNYT